MRNYLEKHRLLLRAEPFTRIVNMGLDRSDNHSAVQLRSLGFDRRIEPGIIPGDFLDNIFALIRAIDK